MAACPPPLARPGARRASPACAAARLGAARCSQPAVAPRGTRRQARALLLCRASDGAEAEAEQPAEAAAAAAAPPPPLAAVPDVYESPPALLRDGLRRHTISVFVADETGMINRVAGVFARRGYNIESLAVGLNVDRALFTIVVTGTDGEVSQLLKQIYKLPNVIRADDLTYAPSVERGLMLLQLDVEAAGRREVLDLATIFRASVVDVSERSLMLSCTGDPGKLRAFQRALSHYPVRALARTGKLSLRREAAYNEQRRLQLASAARSRAERAPDDGGGKEAEAEGAAAAAGAAAGAAAAAAASAAPGSAAASSGGGDVYKLEPGDATGVWDYAVLTPHWGDGAGWGEGGIPHKKAGRSAYKPHTLSLLVDNAPGVLDRVTGVIARRGYNVQSLGVGPAEAADVSRITLVVPGTPADVAKLLTQLLKLPAVRAAEDITAIPFVERELMLIKVAAPPAARSGLMDLASVFRAKVSDISGDTLTVEVVGDAEKLAQLQGLLGPFGVLEVARTGRVALTRDAGVNTALLEELASDSFFS